MRLKFILDPYRWIGLMVWLSNKVFLGNEQGTQPREVQVMAYEQGIIPYIPADKTVDWYISQMWKQAVFEALSHKVQLIQWDLIDK